MRRSAMILSLAAAALCAAAASLADDPRGARAIRDRIDALRGAELATACQAKGLSYPPACTLLRVFKKERECEVWAAAGKDRAMQLVATVPICAVDDRPGPKLRQGDGKTPEGFFRCELHYGSRMWWMWIKLEEGAVEDPGRVDDGSSFKIFIDYPSGLDRCMTRLARFHDPGGAIFLHGNCVTAGCVSFTNIDFLPVFAFSSHHRSAACGPLQVHVFPFRFDRYDHTARSRLAATFDHRSAVEQALLLDFWSNLEEGFELFNRTRLPLRYRPLGQRVFRVGDVSPVVHEIKQRLAAEQFYDGDLDDQFSPRLAAAVRQLQRTRGLSVDGIVGRETLGELGLCPCRYVF